VTSLRILVRKKSLRESARGRSFWERRKRDTAKSGSPDGVETEICVRRSKNGKSEPKKKNSSVLNGLNPLARLVRNRDQSVALKTVRRRFKEIKQMGEERNRLRKDAGGERTTRRRP